MFIIFIISKSYLVLIERKGKPVWYDRGVCVVRRVDPAYRDRLLIWKLFVRRLFFVDDGGGRRIESSNEGICLGGDDGLCICRLTCAIHRLKMQVIEGEKNWYNLLILL